jgi:hypothetical protein
MSTGIFRRLQGNGSLRGEVRDQFTLSGLPRMPARRFPSPWSIEDNSACFIVKAQSGQALAYVYYEEEPGRRSAANLLTRDEARPAGSAADGVKLEIAGRRSYPIFPPPLRVSYLIQIPKTIRLKFKRCRALSSPPLPSARAVYVRTRPSEA